MKKNILLSLIIFFSFSFSFCQIASYKFENNLNDEIGNYTAFHTKNGVINNQIEFRNEGDGYKNVILLNSTQGIFLPKTLNSKLDFSKSIEFIFDFKITDLGSSSGRKEILELSRGWNDDSEGINIWTDKINDNRYKVILNYSDGGYNRGEPNHPGGSRNTIGFFDVNEWVKFRLILDFENKKWETILNSESSSGLFDDFYDFEKIKQTILNNHIRIGWLNNALNKQNKLHFSVHPDFTSSMMFDNFKTFSPKSDGDANDLIAALIAMKNHVNGDNILSNAQLKNYLSIIQINWSGNFAKVRNEVFDFINAYEYKNDPLFAQSNGKLVGGSTVKIVDLPIPSQAIYYIQQQIFDDEYTSSNISKMEGIKFEAHEAFPGKVSDSAPRVETATVEINGDYNYVPGARHLGDTWDVIRPTGYYAAAGEVITISIPPAFVDKEIKIMIGAHQRDHTKLSDKNRFVRISNKFVLTSESSKIANPFGGGIYVLVPEGLNLGWFDVTIKKAVKAPYFSSREGKKSDPSLWKEEVDKMHVPWVDLESDKFMTTLTSRQMSGSLDSNKGTKTPTDPTEMMQKWDEILDAFNYAGGRPFERTRPEYIITDSRIPDGSYGTGYPAVYQDDGMTATAVFGHGDVIPEKEFYKQGHFTTVLHEMGHLEHHPTLGNAVESIVHLPMVYFLNKYHGVSLDESFKYSAFQRLTMDETTMDWMMTNNFRNNREIDRDPTMIENVNHEVRYQHRGHAMYVEIADLFGWEAVHNTHKVFFEEWKQYTGINHDFMNFDKGNGISDDELIVAASNAIGVNMIPFFHFWGRQPSSATIEQLKDLPKSDKVFCQLIEYKNLVPGNTSEFQKWYDSNYDKVGNVQQPRYTYATSNFDKDEYSKNMKEQIDLIISTYYGDSYKSTDTDSDGISDICDNCIDTFNSDQSDVDYDGIGDVCDDDIDGDGITNENDNCPSVANVDQADSDDDEIGDVCDTFNDPDKDGVLNLALDYIYLGNFNSHNYYASKTKKTWDEARVMASSNSKSYLAVIESEEENKFIFESAKSKNLIEGIASYRGLWIGYTDIIKKGKWKWVNGSESSFTNWADGLNSDSHGDYAVMVDTGKWSLSALNLNWDWVVKNNHILEVEVITDKCPETPLGATVNFDGCKTFSLPVNKIFSLPINNNKVEVTNATCIGNSDGSIGLSVEDNSHDYTISITGKDPILIAGENMTASVLGLAKGTYSVCFKVTGQDAYEQCFEVVIGEPKALSAFIDVDNDKRSTSIQLGGSKSYSIEVNGERFEVKDNNFNTILPTGLSIVKISTNLGCQGVIEKEIFISEDIFYYPNPSRGEVDVFVNGEDKGVKMSVFTTKGDLVFTRDQNILESRKTELDLTDVPAGTYIVTLEGKTVRKTFKIVKR